MKKKLFLLLLLLFALLATIIVIPRLIDGTLSIGPDITTGESAVLPPTETLEDKTYPFETVPIDQAEETTPEQPTEPEKYDPGEPIDREKIETNLIFASDMHYLSPNATDYGNAFNELIDNGDGKVVRYMVEIWEAFEAEVIAAQPDALILSGDLTMNGEKANHQELAMHLEQIEAYGVPVLVLPGNHDINNPYATEYFGEAQSFVETVTPEEFRSIYGAYGYDEAASHAPDSLSYLYILNETTWIMMLDSCIYNPDNEVDGEIREGTMQWIEQCLRDAYAQGITVVPVAHHNLQELSQLYVDECVIRNHKELIQLFEYYLTPAFFSGHLHVQRVQKHMTGPGMPPEEYGITEIVSNSLVIPPCQYGVAQLRSDGSIAYHAKNTDVSGWAAAYGVANDDLLNFQAFSDAYIASVIHKQTYDEIDSIPEHMKEAMVSYYSGLYRDYYAGRQINYEERTEERGYKYWKRFRDDTIQFRQITSMLKDSMENNNQAEIPNPIRQIWSRD